MNLYANIINREVTFEMNKNSVSKHKISFTNVTNKQQTPWFQSAKRTIPIERPPLVGEVSAYFSG
jgi:hypothetical protein